MKKISFITVLLFLFTSTHVFSQRVEMGIFGGTSYYIGDINPKKHFELLKPAFGGLVRFNINPRLTIKINGYYGNVAGDDAITKFNEKRNLHFKTHILEFGTQLEINFLPYVTGHDDHYFAPYIFGGISAFGFNPKALYENNWVELQPLGTEGQGTIAYYDRKPYSLNSIAIPFGLGFKYSLSKSICFGAEWGLRKTNTDYIDDVSTTYVDPSIITAEKSEIAAALADRSLTQPGDPPNTGLQRGNSKSKDWYSFAGAFFTFKISRKKKGDCPTYRNYKKYKDYYVD
ncbi:MAG: DUF6089 family protein [Bacteroidales bacterium]|nr:DUF6089 family protein [Bacteroidales bacterium]